MIKTAQVIVASLLLALWGADTVLGESCHRCGFAHQRDYSCGAKQKKNDEAPRDLPGPENPRDLQPPAGVFAAPPRNGAVSSRSRSYGINGMKIKFPSLEIGLPGIELPSFSCLHRPPEMHLPKSRASFIPFSHAAAAGPQARALQGPGGGQQPRDLTPPCEEGSRAVEPAPEIPCPTETSLLRMLDEIRSREEVMAVQMQQLEHRLARLQQLEAASQQRSNELGSAQPTDYPAYPNSNDPQQVRWSERYPVRPSAHMAPEPLPVPRRLPVDIAPRRLPPDPRITGVSNLSN